MFDFLKSLMRLRSDKRGVTALEYALIAGLIAVVLVGTLTTLGTTLKGTFSTISSDLPAAAAASASS